ACRYRRGGRRRPRPPPGLRSQSTCASLIGQDAASASAVEGVAPQRLDGIAAGAECDVGGRSLAGADPGALVAVLSAAAVEPTAVGIRVRDRLGILVAAHDRE